MKKALLFLSFFSTSFVMNAEKKDFYYTFNNQKLWLDRYTGKYTVEFEHDPTTYNETMGVRIASGIFITTDTSTLSSYGTPYRIYPVFRNSANSEVYLTSNIVLKFKENVSQEARYSLTQQFGLMAVTISEPCEVYRTEHPLATAQAIYETGLVTYCTPDFREAAVSFSTPNDPYYNKQFYLHNTGQLINDGHYGTAGADIHAPEAWDITTGDPNISIAVIDDGVDADHYDLPNSRQLRLPGSNFIARLLNDTPNFNNPQPYNCGMVYHCNSHGTGCAGIIAATQNNGIGIAGIAPQCKIMPVNVTNSPNQLSGSEYARSIWFADSNGAKVISCSWGYNVRDTNYIPSITTAIDNAIKHGKVVVFAAGNLRDRNTDNYVSFPANSGVPGLLCVGASDRDDHVAEYSPIAEQIDLTTPSQKAFQCQISTEGPEVWTTDRYGISGFNPFGGYQYPCQATPCVCFEELPAFDPADTTAGSFTGHFGGTSAAAPQVAAVAALILSVNGCLSAYQVKDILQQTADKPGGYNYQYDLNKKGHSKELGYGRINAGRAVAAAVAMKRNTLDLYIKDAPQDLGIPGYYANDNSPDIWVRNQADGYTHQTHQDPEYQANDSVYVYVRVRNKSCVASAGTGVLSIYWSKASSWSSWPQNWDGTQPTVGNKIGTRAIPNLQPGQDTILLFRWKILQPAPSPDKTWARCLLARIENLSGDPIAAYPGRLDQEVISNNNVTMRNLKVVDIYPGRVFPVVEGVSYPHGSFMYMGNPLDEEKAYDFHFGVPDFLNGQTPDITQEAEVRVFFDADAWAILESSGQLNQEGIQVAKENELILTAPSVALRNIPLPPNTRLPVYVGFSFLTDEITANEQFEYKVAQAFSSEPDSILGSENFIIRKTPRDPFEAEAGPDVLINPSQSVTLNAQSIHEAAIYNWYDTAGTLIYTGTDLTVSPAVTEKYKLEIISNVDGFKDYDAATVHVRSHFITSLSPNPAHSQVVISYQALQAASAYLMVQNAVTNSSNSYLINPVQTTQNINITGFSPGVYTITLVCDGIVADTKLLSIN